MQERLEEVEQREVAVEREATHVRALQQQLLGQHPDLHRLSEMMSERQREEREARDAKVLRVLRTKDQSIATLNGQVQGLERSLDETRAKLGAADRALEDKHKEMERASRDHQASLASAQVSLVFPRSRLPPAWPHSLLFELGGSIVGERRQALVCCPDYTPLVSSLLSLSLPPTTQPHALCSSSGGRRRKRCWGCAPSSTTCRLLPCRVTRWAGCLPIVSALRLL